VREVLTRPIWMRWGQAASTRKHSKDLQGLGRAVRSDARLLILVLPEGALHMTLRTNVDLEPPLAPDGAREPGAVRSLKMESSPRREPPRSAPVRQPERHILPKLVAHLPALRPLFEGLAGEAALEIEHALEWVNLNPSAVLFKEGDVANDAYVLTAGQLAVVLGTGVERRTIAHIHPGELVGEMALLADAPRSATVVALHDSYLIRLPRRAVDVLISEAPEARQFLFRNLTSRLRRTSRHPSSAERAAERVALVALGPVEPLKDTLDWLSSKLSPVIVGFSKDGDRWGECQASAVGPIIYMADNHHSVCARRCIDESDRVVFVADTRSEPAGLDFVAAAARHNREMNLVLVNRTDAALPNGAAAWINHFELSHILHVRSGDAADYERVLRLISRTSVCVVFSGGGARGLAHIGVVHALEEKGIPIDAVAGTSMGAMVGALVAQGFRAREIQDRMRRHVVDNNPVGHYTLPLVSFVSGRRLTRMFKDACQDAKVEDLWRSFFCVSTDLASGSPVVHRSGPLWRALRASTAIPGLFSPVLGDGKVLVDGGLVDNMPTVTMRSLNRGAVIGVDVTSDFHVPVYQGAIEEKSWWSLLVHGRGQAPSMARVLMSSTTAASRAQRDSAGAATDLLVEPNLDGVNVLSFRALDRAVEAGYRAAQEAIKAQGFSPQFQRSQTLN
jgi:NTE family protein